MADEQDLTGMLEVVMRNRYPGAPDHDDPEPTTEAGKRLADILAEVAWFDGIHHYPTHIAAIEAEAARDERKRLRDDHMGWHRGNDIPVGESPEWPYGCHACRLLAEPEEAPHD